MIEATIDHEHAYVQSKEMTDIYGTKEPMTAFHQRITFCLDIHNQSVKVTEDSFVAYIFTLPKVASLKCCAFLRATQPHFDGLSVNRECCKLFRSLRFAVAGLSICLGSLLRICLEKSGNFSLWKMVTL